MQTIGVLGGLGPQATMDFEERIHRVSQRLIPQLAAGGYPPLVVFYLRQPPFILDEDMRPVLPLQPHPALLQAAAELGRLADFLVITANGPHMVQPLVEQASGKPVLSMIDGTLQEVQRRAPHCAGLLTFGPPMIYAQPLAALGVPCVTLPDDLQRGLDRAVWAVWEGRDGKEDVAAVLAAVDHLRQAGADAVILGCTELPVLLRGQDDAPDMVNPTQLLAEAAVRRALS